MQLLELLQVFMLQTKQRLEADEDLNNRLKAWVGSKYKFFKFDYATSPKNAFEKECELWHDYGGPQGKLDNERHPQRPNGTDWKCPRCKTFG